MLRQEELKADAEGAATANAEQTTNTMDNTLLLKLTNKFTQVQSTPLRCCVDSRSRGGGLHPSIHVLRPVHSAARSDGMDPVRCTQPLAGASRLSCHVTHLR